MNCLRFSRKLLAPVLLGGTSLAMARGNAQVSAPVQALKPAVVLAGFFKGLAF